MPTLLQKSPLKFWEPGWKILAGYMALFFLFSATLMTDGVGLFFSFTFSYADKPR